MRSMEVSALIELLATELGFSVSGRKYQLGAYDIRRAIPETDERFLTMGWQSEYTSMRITGDRVEVQVFDPKYELSRISTSPRYVSLADPKCFEQLREILNAPNALCGSRVAMPVGGYVFTD